MTKSLQEFAEEVVESTKHRCRICILPEADEINKAYNSGVRRGIILQWLITEKNYDSPQVTESGLEKHISRCIKGTKR